MTQGPWPDPLILELWGLLEPENAFSYTIKNIANRDSAEIIRSVFMEEMLHMVLAGNVLTAIGGGMKLGEAQVPQYPLSLEFEGKKFRDREFQVDLAPFSQASVTTFLRIELPSGFPPMGAQLEAASEIVIPGYTIGDFYERIKTDLSELCREFDEELVFDGNADHQVNQQYYWNGGGKPIVVHNLTSAHEAIDIIVEQGEGAGGTINDGDAHYFDQPQEMAHFFRFNQIIEGRYYCPGDRPHDPPSGQSFPVDYDQVYPIKSNAKSEDYAPGGELHDLNTEFNRYYSMTLAQLEEGFNGNPKVIYTAIHCTGQKIKIADIVDKYDALAPLTHSRAASGSRAAPLACLVDLRGCFESDQIHSEKHSWLGVYVFLYESVSDH